MLHVCYICRFRCYSVSPVRMCGDGVLLFCSELCDNSVCTLAEQTVPIVSSSCNVVAFFAARDTITLARNSGLGYGMQRNIS
jgi:hypothetical protein